MTRLALSGNGNKSAAPDLMGKPEYENVLTAKAVRRPDRLVGDSIAGIFPESDGRNLAEAIFVCARKFAKVPEPPIHGDIGNGCGFSICMT